MNTISDQFQRACNTLHRPPLAKMISPGLPRFARRLAARKGILSGPVEIQLFFDERMTVVLPEVISEVLYTYAMFDETVTWMVLQSVRPGNMVLDIGAHFGYFSLLFARLAGDAGRVVCFEPTPSTFSVLSGNTRNHANIEALNCAAGDAPGNIAITDFGLKYSAWNTLAAESRMSNTLPTAQGRQIQVQLVRPDEVCQQRGLKPDFIKIDAENFEDHVVDGLTGILSAARPLILMETGSAQSLAAARKLVAYGYTLRVSDGPGTLYDWNGTLEDANSRFKDVLFAPAA